MDICLLSLFTPHMLLWSWSPPSPPHTPTPRCCPSNSLVTTIQPSLFISISNLTPPKVLSLLSIFVCVILFLKPVLVRPIRLLLFLLLRQLWFFFFFASSVITLFSFFVASPLLAACLKLFHEPMHDSNHADFKWFKVWYYSFLSFLLSCFFPSQDDPILIYFCSLFPVCSSDFKHFAIFPPPFIILRMWKCSSFWFHSNPNIVIGSLITVMVHFIDCSLKMILCWSLSQPWVCSHSLVCCYGSRNHCDPKGEIYLFWGFIFNKLAMN